MTPLVPTPFVPFRVGAKFHKRGVGNSHVHRELPGKFVDEFLVVGRFLVGRLGVAPCRIVAAAGWRGSLCIYIYIYIYREREM